MATPTVSVSAKLIGFDRVLSRLDAGRLRRATAAGLMGGGLRLEGALKRDARVRTGRLRAAWSTRQDRDWPTLRVVVGNNVRYAPFVGGRGRPTSFRDAGERYIIETLRKDRDGIVRTIRDRVRRAMEGGL